MVNIMVNICVDFDGVLNNYEGWAGEDELYTPRKGVEDFLKILSKHFEVTILSTRKPEKIVGWLSEYGLMQYVDNVTSVKPPAICYIDDRSVNFGGDYLEVLDTVLKFKAYWEK